MGAADDIATVTYFLVLLRPGPRHSELARFADGHVEHIDAMAARGVVLLGGDFRGGIDDIEGAYLLHTRTHAEAAAWADRDPFVREGVYTYEIVPWELVGIEPTAIDPTFH
jgi:uncharacterized protein YciI